MMRMPGTDCSIEEQTYVDVFFHATQLKDAIPPESGMLVEFALGHHGPRIVAVDVCTVSDTHWVTLSDRLIPWVFDSQFLARQERPLQQAVCARILSLCEQSEAITAMVRARLLRLPRVTLSGYLRMLLPEQRGRLKTLGVEPSHVPETSLPVSTLPHDEQARLYLTPQVLYDILRTHAANEIWSDLNIPADDIHSLADGRAKLAATLARGTQFPARNQRAKACIKYALASGDHLTAGQEADLSGIVGLLRDALLFYHMSQGGIDARQPPYNARAEQQYLCALFVAKFWDTSSVMTSIKNSRMIIYRELLAGQRDVRRHETLDVLTTRH